MQARTIFLSEGEIDSIHEASLVILEKVGVKVGSDRLCAMLGSKGARVEGNNVRIPRQMVQEILELSSTKKEMLLASRNLKCDVILPTPGKCIQSTSGFSSFVMDVDSGEIRKALCSDLAEMAVIADFLPVVDIFWPIVMPTDCHPRMEELQALSISLKNTVKHIQCSCSGEAVARWMLRLGSAVAGGEDALAARPLFSGSIAPISPLYFDKYGIEAMAVLAEAGVPVAPMTMASAGTKAPVTLAGALSLVNAEELATLVILKSVNSDAPVIYAADVPPADLKTGVVDYTSPEYILLSAGLAQLSSRYMLPSMVSHAASEDIPTDRISLERNIMYAAWGMMLGSDVSCWMGTFQNVLSASTIHLVKDAEICMQAAAYVRNFQVDTGTLALEAISRVGPGGHFLSDSHTVDNLHHDLWGRKWTESFLLEWSEGEDYIECARRKVKDILASHQPEPLSFDIQKEMDSIIEAAEQDLVG